MIGSTGVPSMMHVAIVEPDRSQAFATRRSLQRVLACQQFTLWNSAAQALAKNTSDEINLLILELHLLDGHGLHLLKELRQRGSITDRTQVVVRTALNPHFYTSRCLSEGSAGFVCKDSGMELLHTVLQGVLCGNQFYPDPTLMPSWQRISDKILSLSNRSVYVLQGLHTGHSVEWLAQTLGVAHSTIYKHGTLITEAFEVDTLDQALIKAERLGIVMPLPRSRHH